MKMRLGDKLVLIFILLFVMAQAGVAIAFTFNAFSYDACKAIFDICFNNIWVRIGLAAFSILLIMLCFKLIFFSGGSRKQPERTILTVQSTTLGEIGISEDALKQMVQKVVLGNPSVRECDIKFIMATEGAGHIAKVKLVFIPDTIIPEESAKLQSEIAEYVKMHAGIENLGVQLFVDTPEVKTA